MQADTSCRKMHSNARMPAAGKLQSSHCGQACDRPTVASVAGILELPLAVCGQGRAAALLLDSMLCCGLLRSQMKTHGTVLRK